MSSPPSTALLVVLALLAGRSALAQPSLPGCEEEILRVDLRADVAGPAPEVCISPGRATSLVFDSALLPEQMQLEHSGRFRLMEPGRLGILLVPSGELQPGERLKLSVRFADDAAPTSASFTLVAHSTRSVRQVEVSRRPRTAESLQTELLQQEAKLRRLQEENARLHLELSRARSLAGLDAAGVMDTRGVSAHTLSLRATSSPDGRALTAHEAFSQRSISRVAVIVDVENLDTSQSWTPSGARLTSSSGEDLKVLALPQSEPIPPGRSRRLIIEAEATDTEAQGTYTLTLMEADGLRSLTVEGVTFPGLVMKPWSGAK